MAHQAHSASDLIRAVREVAADNPDRIYQAPDPQVCEYADTAGNPLCLIGHALHRLGRLEQAANVGNEENIAAILVYDWQDEVKSTRTQRDWLHSVQKAQDTLQPWGEAVRTADQQHGPIG